MYSKSTSKQCRDFRVAWAPILTLIGVTAASVFGSQQPSSESGPGGPESQKVKEAAVGFARSVATEGTAEFTSALRRAIALASGRAVSEDATRALTVYSPVRGLLDLDARYRRLCRRAKRTAADLGRRSCPPGTYSDTVAITGSGRLCTGTIIATNAVLTAAHCYCGGVTEKVFVGNSVNASLTSLGVSSGAAMIKCTDDLKTGDVAVLRLNGTASVAPQSFAADSLVVSAKTGRAVGFGQTANPITEPAGIKRRVDVPIASVSCSGTVTTPSGQVTDAAFYGCSVGQELVAGAASLDRDTCNGDSGGPLFVAAQNSTCYPAAATSRPTGPPGLRPCGDGGIYVRTDSRVVKWLSSLGISVNVGPSQ